MDKYYWAWIQTIPGIGNETIKRLKQEFLYGEDVLKASSELLKKSKCFVKQEGLNNLLSTRHTFDKDSFVNKLIENKVSLLSIEEDMYPTQLKEIYNAPQILYLKGKLPMQEKRIGIVGSRRCTAYGENVAKTFAKGLTRAGFAVVSGVAVGIDAAAHWGAISEGETIGVLGCGIDKVYPHENYQLYDEIERHGALISEYPLGTKPLAVNFPQRNRIIAGLCQGILVIEAVSKSGSLITAELASSEGRDVFAVPGNIYSPHSEGTHHLIKQGAKLVTNVEDIVQEYDILHGNKVFEEKKLVELDLKLSKDESIIYKTLDYTIPIGMDELIYRLRDKVSNISFILLQMKLKGIIQESNPNYYIKANRGALHE